jgi:transcriptional regulator with PAS, ATPase and Fis domain
MERQQIVEALKRNDGNRLAAADDLGIHKSTLFRKIKSFQIHVPARIVTSPDT